MHPPSHNIGTNDKKNGKHIDDDDGDDDEDENALTANNININIAATTTTKDTYQRYNEFFRAICACHRSQWYSPLSSFEPSLVSSSSSLDDADDEDDYNLGLHLL